MPTITVRALVKRINRRLCQEDEQLHTTRGERWRSYLGDYYVVNFNSKAVVAQHVDPERLARELDVLKDGETVA